MAASKTKSPASILPAGLSWGNTPPLGNSKSHIQFAARSRVTIGHNAGQAVPARRLFFQIVYECLPDRVHPQPTTSAFPIVFMKPTTTPSIFAVPSGKVPLGPARITRSTDPATKAPQTLIAPGHGRTKRDAPLTWLGRKGRNGGDTGDG